MSLIINLPPGSPKELVDLREGIYRQVDERNGIYSIFRGVYGNRADCHAIVREYEEHPDGFLTHLWGCKIPYNGIPINRELEGISIGKSLISIVPREIIGKSFLLMTSLILLFIFSKKRFMRYLEIYSYILSYNLSSKHYGEKFYGKFTREIKRAFNKSILKTEGNSLSEKEAEKFREQWGPRFNKEEYSFKIVLKNFLEFILFFIDSDNAYRFPLQDISEKINKENVRKNVLKEVNRLFMVMIDRSKPNGIRHKVIQMRRLILISLIFSKRLRVTTRDFLLELRKNLCSLDESDWYFSLGRTDYDFMGIPFDVRMKEKTMIDKLNGHIFIHFKDSEE